MGLRKRKTYKKVLWTLHLNLQHSCPPISAKSYGRREDGSQKLLKVAESFGKICICSVFWWKLYIIPEIFKCSHRFPESKKLFAPIVLLALIRNFSTGKMLPHFYENNICLAQKLTMLEHVIKTIHKENIKNRSKRKLEIRNVK